MSYIKCSHCGEMIRVKSEFMILCPRCNKRLDNSFKVWVEKNPSATFEHYISEMCVSELALTGLGEQRRVSKSIRLSKARGRLGVAFLIATALIVASVCGYFVYKGSQKGASINAILDDSWKITYYDDLEVTIKFPYNLVEVTSFAPESPSGSSFDEGSPADGSHSGSLPADGSPADGSHSDGSPADGSPADGSHSDGSPADGSPADGSLADSSHSDGSPADGDSTMAILSHVSRSWIRQGVAAVSATRVEFAPAFGVNREAATQQILQAIVQNNDLKAFEYIPSDYTMGQQQMRARMFSGSYLIKVEAYQFRAVMVVRGNTVWYFMVAYLRSMPEGTLLAEKFFNGILL